MLTASEKPPRLVVVGSTNTDLVVGVPHIPAPGETVLGGAMQTVAGGKGANQAVAVARLGAHVTFIARVGDDGFGDMALAGFRDEGIDLSHITRTAGVASGVALIAVSDTGENSIVVAPGANAHLSPADIDAAAREFDRAQAVVVSLEVGLPAVARAVEMGASRKIPVILNPAPARALPPELLTQVAVLTPNQTEACFLAGMDEDTDPVTVATRLLETGVGVVIMTLGATGSLVVTPDGVERIPAVRVHAIDTVAAGDCFTGAFAVEFARGKSLRESIQFASRAAALSVTRRGAQASLPTRAEVETFTEGA